MAEVITFMITLVGVALPCRMGYRLVAHPQGWLVGVYGVGCGFTREHRFSRVRSSDRVVNNSATIWFCYHHYHHHHHHHPNRVARTIIIIIIIIITLLQPLVLS